MLSPADQSLVDRETRLPGLAKLLDENQFLEAMQKAVPEACFLTARRTYIRHKPGMNCLVRYELTTRDNTIDVYAKTFAADAHSKIIKAAQRPVIESTSGLGRIILEPDHIQVCNFPNDDKLKILYRLGDPEKKQKLVSRVIKSDFDLFEGMQLETLQYKPERRYVARLSRHQKTHAAVKFYSAHAFPNAFHNAIHVTKRTSNLFPKLIGKSRRHYALTFEWLDGFTLNDAFALPNFDMQWIQSLAVAMAELHEPGHKSLPQQDNTIKAAKLAEQARGISFLSPNLENSANKLVDSLTSALASQPEVSIRIHNDFYAKQVLCTDKGIRLVDSDDLCRGNPTADLGLFIAHLERNTISGGLDPRLANEVKHSLIDHYKPEHKHDIIDAVDLFTAIGLVQLAHHPYRTCQTDWQILMAQILDRADFYLQKSKSHTVTKAVQIPTSQTQIQDSFNTIKDPAMHTIVNALNPELIAPMIQQHLKPINKSDKTPRLHNIRVRRHKAGRRCVIEYTFDNDAANGANEKQVYIGKIRARGLDTKTYKLNKSLYQNGFEKGCSDGIEIPEPIGCIPELQMWVQRSVKGNSLFPLLKGSGATDIAKKIAKALYKLHTAKIPTKRNHTLQDELTILKSQLSKVANTHKHWSEDIRAILYACQNFSSKVPPSHYTGIHRDFYHDQLLLSENKLYLLDFDLYSMGDPALDIGNFIAHIEEQSLREYGDVNACETVTRTLINYYCQLSGHDFRDSIELYSTLSFVRHIAISQRIKKRNPFTNQIIKLCERKLNIEKNSL